MASLMENLIAVLQQECVEYNGLLELSGRKTPIIVAGDLNNLEKITDEEQEWVGRIAHLEKKRTEITADIADVLNKDVKTMKLRDLVQMLSARPAEQKQLEAEVITLRQDIEVQERQNENIEKFIQKAHKYVGIETLDPYALRELVQAIYVEAPDKSSGKRRQSIHIKYDGMGFIPLDELMKRETA